MIEKRRPVVVSSIREHRTREQLRPDFFFEIPDLPASEGWRRV